MFVFFVVVIILFYFPVQHISLASFLLCFLSNLLLFVLLALLWFGLVWFGSVPLSSPRFSLLFSTFALSFVLLLFFRFLFCCSLSFSLSLSPGVAKATFTRPSSSPSSPPPVCSLPSHQHEFDFQWIGLIGLKDPVRPGVKDSVAVALHAGIYHYVWMDVWYDTLIAKGKRRRKKQGFTWSISASTNEA